MNGENQAQGDPDTVKASAADGTQPVKPSDQTVTYLGSSGGDTSIPAVCSQTLAQPNSEPPPVAQRATCRSLLAVIRFVPSWDVALLALCIWATTLSWTGRSPSK